MAAVLTGLGSAAMACRDLDDKGTGAHLLAHYTTIFRGMWDHREQLRRASFEEREPGIEAHAVEWCVIQLTSLYQHT